MEYLSARASLALGSLPPPAFGAIRIKQATSVFWERQMMRMLCQEPITAHKELHSSLTIIQLAPLVSSCRLSVTRLVEVALSTPPATCSARELSVGLQRTSKSIILWTLPTSIW